MAKIITAAEAADLIRDGMTLGVSGFGAFASPDYVMEAMSRKFKEQNTPRDLTIVSGVAPGDFVEDGCGLSKIRDDTTGQHWPMEQTTAVMRSRGLHYDPAVWYAAMNMIYSDYFKTAKKHGVNTVEFFADMTDAFLDDKDAGAPEEKISAYYHCVVLPQNLPQE